MFKPTFLVVSFILANIYLTPTEVVLAETLAESKATEINFPVGSSSIGTLERIVEGTDYGQEHSPGTTFAQLRGKVTIPPNTFLGVTVRDTLSDPVPILGCIPANLVHSLTLTGLAKVDERTIKSILRFKNVRCLQFDRADLDDKGLAMLAAFPNLESLVVSHTQITGTTFTSLCSAKKLSRLDVGSNALKEETLPILARFKHLQTLAIGRCHLRNPHLSFLGNLQNLSHLDLSENNLLSDPCMKYVSRLKNLTNIKLDGTHISHKGLLMMKGLPLKTIRLSPNVLSPSQKAEMEKMFPGAKVKVSDKQSKKYGIYKELFEDKN